MAFLYPVALYGLFFNLIPIVIHLMNLQRSKKVLFSNVKFLSTIQKKTSRSYQIRRWLVLLSRICFISFLVLAFAKPVILNEGAVKGRSTKKIIYLDNSLSMESLQGEKSALDIGVTAVETLLETNPTQSDILFLTDNRLGQSRFQKVEDVLGKLPEVTYVTSKQSISSVLNATNRARKRLGTEMTNAELYLISDFQKNNLDLSNKSINPDTSLSVKLLPIVVDASPNLQVDSVWFDAPFISKGEQALIHVKVSNNGTDKADEVVMRLFLSEIQKSSITVSLDPGQSKIINLNFIADTDGLQKGRIQLDDYPITFDNDFFFCFYVSANVNVVTITEPKDQTYVTKAFANEQMFTQKGFVSNAISYDAVQLSDLLVIQNAPLNDEASRNMIVKQLNAGKHVLLFPGKNMNTEDLNGILQAAQLTNVSVGQNNMKDSVLVKLKAPEPRHPFFANVFENFDSKMSTPLILPLLKINGDVERILSTVNGESALAKMENNAGGVLYLSSTPLDNKMTTLHKHSLFIPVLYRIAMESASGNDQLYTRVGSEALMSLDSSSVNQTFALKSGEFEFVPDQTMKSGKVSMNVTGPEISAGFYDVQANQKKKSTLAVNVNPLESDLTTLSTADLKIAFREVPNVSIVKINDDRAIKNLASNSSNHIPLWKYSLILSLMFLLVETAFIRFFK